MADERPATGPAGGSRAWRRFDRARPWAALIGLALGTKALMVLAGLAAHPGGTDLLPAVTGQWIQWDTVHYLYIAAHGYSAGGDNGNVIVWFPLYPALVGLVGRLMDLPLAAMVVNNLASLAATVVLYELARLDGDERAAWRTAVAWNIFPTAYFLFNGYTEGLFCALAFGCVLAARSGRWVVAGVLGAFATATRVQGLALIPFFLVEAYATYTVVAGLWRRLAGLGLVPLGFLAFLIINVLTYHDPLYFTVVDRDHFSKQLSPPWTGLATSWRLMRADAATWDRLTVGAGEMLGGLSFYVVSALTALRLRPADLAYMAGVTVIATWLSFWLSEPRYLISAYPLFLLAGRIKNPAVQAVLCTFSLAALVTLSIGFTGDRWAF
jgi:hypothetical protein